MLRNKTLVAGIIGCVTSTLWAIQTFGLSYIYHDVYKQYKAQGLTFNKAKDEITTRGFRAFISRSSTV